MNKRIFIAINIPDEIKRTLLSNENRWKNLHVRWTGMSNMHITVEFIGNTNRSGLNQILEAVGSAVFEMKPFYLFLDKLVLGPDTVNPRMFWATISIDDNILNLKKLISQNLKLLGFNLEEREFTPHITLARARGNQLKGKKTNIPLNHIKFKVENIEVMQSQLHPGGSRYQVVESFKLGNNI